MLSYYRGKDNIFKLIFGNPEYPDYSSSLCHAIYGISVNTIENTVMDDIIYNVANNSFTMLIYSKIVYDDSAEVAILSKRNRYFASYAVSRSNMLKEVHGHLLIYNQFLLNNHMVIPDSVSLPISSHEIIAFYYGLPNSPAYEIIDCAHVHHPSVATTVYNLNSAQIAPDWHIKLININSLSNSDLLSNCRPLHDFIFLSNRMYENIQIGMSLEAASRDTILACINMGLLPELFILHGYDVYRMLINRYRYEKDSINTYNYSALFI